MKRFVFSFTREISRTYFSKRFLLFGTLFLLCAFLFQSSLAFADTLKEQFRSAPLIVPGESISLKPLPLWHTNGPLTDELIREFFEKGTENGFGGYTFLPLGRHVPTEPKYLTDGYFEYFGKILEEAKKRGQKIVFYDDVDFPSGTAGGKMLELYPDDITKRLDMEEWTVTGPQEKSEFRFSRKLNQNWKDGMIQAVVAMDLKTWKRIDLTKDASADISDTQIVWSVPDGEWKVMVFYAVTDGNKVDNMDPDAMKKFLSLTYEKYYERFPEHFGTTIPVSFFDDVTITQTKGGRNWTRVFNAKYEELYGRSPALDYPAIFMSIGPETASARVRIWTTRNELFADGYPKAVHEWCAAHGLMSSGHPQGPYTIQPNNMCGDEMLTHRSSDAPLFDSIHYYGHGRDGFKVPTSAAVTFDKPLCLVEIYGNYRDGVRNGKPEFDDRMLYRSGMEIFCRGGNVLLPHGIWTDPGKMYIPPDISWRNVNLKGTLPQYGEWVSRISLILRHSQHVADIGIVYPIDNLKAFFYFHKNFVPRNHSFGVYVPSETDYLAVGSDLTSRIYRDFTYLHPDTMASRCSVGKTADGRTVYQLKNEKNPQDYEVLILTGSEVISRETLRTVLEFYRAGGKVLATTRLPDRASEGPEFDAEICAMIEELFGVDPRVQGQVEAQLSGQEDIVRPASFRAYREQNAYGQYVMQYPGVETRALSEIRRERAIFLPKPTPDALRGALDALIAVPDVRIVSHDGKRLPTVDIAPRGHYDYDGMVQYIHKVKDGRDFYFIANSSDSGVSLDVSLRGTFRTLEFWDPMTGEMTAVPESMVTREAGFVKISGLELAPIQSKFIVGTKE
ncbi:MAG: hypothetical protein J6A23_08290 [Thermoguttaceae bacterium]|nr:hypothetical protein [Thermoguttaceae bacterium]